MKGGRKGMQS